MSYLKEMAIGGIVILGAIHMYLVGDGTVLGLLIGSLTTVAGVTVGQTTRKE